MIIETTLLVGTMCAAVAYGVFFVLVEGKTKELKQAYLQVKDQNQKFDAADSSRNLIYYSKSIVLSLDSSGNIIFVNQFAQHFFGFHEAELLGQPLLLISTEETFQKKREMIAKMLATRDGCVQCDCEHKTRSGERRKILWTQRYIPHPKSQQPEFLCIGYDITNKEQKNMEA